MPNGATSACSDSIQPSRPNFDAVAVRARGHSRVAGRQGGLGEIDAHATAGSSDKPNLLVTHDISLALLFEALNAVCDLRSFVPLVRELCHREGEWLQISGDSQWSSVHGL